MSIQINRLTKQYSHKKYPTLIFTVSFIVATIAMIANSMVARADQNTPLFPIIGSAYFSNDFNGARSNGLHHATDIFAAKMSPIIAPVNGTVYYVMSPQPGWGYSIGLRDAAGREYNFLHMNNDTPGTDDGAGNEMTAYAPDMKTGNRVEKGQVLGFVGDSGNAENTPPHLHFEIYEADGTAINPYDHLIAWSHVSSPSLYPPLAGETLPYWVSFGGGLSIAAGNFDGDSQSEVVTGAGAGGGPHVKTYDTNNTPLGHEFFAYDQNFTGGIDVAAGDVDGDGIDEIITGAGPGGGPIVRVFKLNGQLIADFFAYDPNFRGGIKVSAGDIDGDGKDEIITGTGPGGGPIVRVFKPTGQLVSDFYAFNPQMMSGIDVASADTTGTTADEIIVSAGPGAGPVVRVINPSNQQILSDFYAYDSRFKGGVRVSAGNVQTATVKAEIMTAPASYGGSHIRLLDGSGNNISQSVYLESWWLGYYDVAAGNGSARVGTGTNRRASMRNIF